MLQRNVEHIRQNYLRPLLREQRIALTHPDEPNDPQQAYRAVDGGEGSGVRWPRYGQMKASGVAWLGEVPGHWDVKRLKLSRA